jgi:hypothetical protein
MDKIIVIDSDKTKEMKKYVLEIFNLSKIIKEISLPKNEKHIVRKIFFQRKLVFYLIVLLMNSHY